MTRMKKLTEQDIETIRKELQEDWQPLGVRDIALAILLETIEDPRMAVAGATSPRKAALDASAAPEMAHLREVLRRVMHLQAGPSEVPNVDTISKEENRSELIKMISVIERDMDEGAIERKDGLRLIADIRVKLNDKFEIEETDSQRRLIVVPQKRNLICAHTQRECTFWPTKEACMQHYKLREI